MSRSGSSASFGLRAEIVSLQTKIGSSAQVRARFFAATCLLDCAML
jgi:hypothetical protein